MPARLRIASRAGRRSRAEALQPFAQPAAEAFAAAAAQFDASLRDTYDHVSVEEMREALLARASSN